MNSGNLSRNIKRGIFFLMCVIILSLGGYVWYTHRVPPVQYKTQAEKNVYVRFDMEAYDAIMKNYWKQMSDADMSQLFQLSLQKAQNTQTLLVLSTTTRVGVADMLGSVMKSATSTDAQKQIALNTLMVALYNLVPVGRDELLSTAQEKELRQTVSNINPINDLYQNLGLQKGASSEAVAQAYTKKTTELAHATSSTAKAELQQVTYAHTVLSDVTSKSAYDQAQIEPTVFHHIFGSTLYVYIDKISPNTIAEFARAVDSASTTPGLSSMILDLRGNIGGDLTFPQYFLGLYLGQNQYVFDLFHQGDYQVQRTVESQFPELNRYKELAVLIDSMTQSTAELLTASLKRFNLAHVVGTKTRGWGSVENTYPIQTRIDPDSTYSLLLVNSLTLRDDNQPIEINGVLPNVDITTAGWQGHLTSYFNSSNLIRTIEQMVVKPPGQ